MADVVGYVALWVVGLVGAGVLAVGPIARGVARRRLAAGEGGDVGLAFGSPLYAAVFNLRLLARDPRLVVTAIGIAALVLLGFLEDEDLGGSGDAP